ncbi:MAG: superinfection immunity protein [Clostridia bacterium]|nr:superinfection immunity protein [Clostridia bacterium]
MLNNFFFLATQATSSAASGGTSIIVLLAWLLILFSVTVPLYPLPLVIAFSRRHTNKVSILLLNLLLGWTFVGWVIALVWSASNSRKSY